MNNNNTTIETLNQMKYLQSSTMKILLSMHTSLFIFLFYEYNYDI